MDLADQSAEITNSSNGDLDISSDTSIERESQEVEQTTSETESSGEKITEMLNERRNKNTTKSIPLDQQLLALSKEEMTFKKEMFKQMEVQDERFNKSMLQGNMVQLTNVSWREFVAKHQQ